MASNPAAFWGGYAEDVMGMSPTSHGAAFYAGNYDTNSLGSLMFGNRFAGDEAQMAGQTSIAGALNQPGFQYFDPGQLISTTLQSLASNDINQLNKVNPQLAQIVLQNAGNPGGEVQAVISFLSDVLMASMPQEMVQAMVSSLQAMGMQYFSQIRKSPQVGNIPTFAQFLIQNFGPTLGL